MRYRKLDADGDMVVGGLGAFYIDQPEAVAQAVRTRLALWLGEWYLDTSDGTPWNTEVLGKYTASTRDAVLRERILATPGVTGISSYSSSYDPGTRRFSVNATLDTVYGQAKIAGPI